jgi:thiol-disulfide isomerase/thioredoxin
MRLIAVLGIGLFLAGCGDKSGTGQPGDDANPPGEQPSAPAGGENSGSSETNGTGESRSADEGSGPVLPPLPGSDAAGPQGSAPPAGDGQEPAQVRVLNWQETLDLVKQQRGKVVVVDLWSHSCLPCLRELPHFAALCEEYPEQVAGIAFNMDYTGLKKEPPESFTDEVAQTVGKYEAGIINVVSSVPDQELWEQIELSAVPAVYVFDQQGNEVKRFDNDNADTEFTYAKDVVPLVEKLLAGTPGE